MIHPVPHNRLSAGRACYVVTNSCEYTSNGRGRCKKSQILDLSLMSSLGKLAAARNKVLKIRNCRFVGMHAGGDGRGSR
jgi:hypothetical protein